MDVSTLMPTDTLLSFLLDYTYPLLFTLIFASSSGVPLPTDLFIVSAAAFAAQGYTNIAFVIVIAALAATLGDNIAFLIGTRIRSMQHQLPGFLKKILAKGEEGFKGCDGRMIFLSRFLFTPLCTPLSFLAGAAKCSHKKFLVYAAPGEFLWATEMAAIGYFFGHYVEEIYGLITDLSIVAVAALGIAYVARKAI